MLNSYTGREIAIFTDVHGLLVPLIAVLEDIKKREITEIYSLGDNIGTGPNPREVLDLLVKENVKLINGNNEDYVVLGVEPFKSYFSSNKMNNQNWTKLELTQEQLNILKNTKHSYDLIVGGKKIGLCHFINDVRIDFFKRNVFSYIKSVNLKSKNSQKQFYYTNSLKQKKLINKRSLRNSPDDQGFVSAQKDPLFGGKEITYYDEIIEGHAHFKMFTKDKFVSVRTLRALGMGYGADPIDTASYIIIKEKKDGYDVEEILIKFDREKMIRDIDNSRMPYKSVINKYVCNFKNKNN